MTLHDMLRETPLSDRLSMLVCTIIEREVPSRGW